MKSVQILQLKFLNLQMKIDLDVANHISNVELMVN